MDCFEGFKIIGFLLGIISITMVIVFMACYLFEFCKYGRHSRNKESDLLSPLNLDDEQKQNNKKG